LNARTAIREIRAGEPFHGTVFRDHDREGNAVFQRRNERSKLYLAPRAAETLLRINCRQNVNWPVARIVSRKTVTA
jgi:hypothetical protein